MSDNKDDKDPKQPPKQGKRKHGRHSRRFQSEPPPPSALFPPTSSSGGGMEDEAETQLLRVLEERRARANVNATDWNASVEGETPPLRRVSFQGTSVFAAPEKKETTSEEQHRLARQRFQKLVLHVRDMNSQKSLNVESSERRPAVEHTRIATVAEEEEEEDGTNVFEGVGGMETELGKSAFAQGDTNTDKVISAALAVDENYNQDDETASVMSDSVYSEGSDIGTAEELPLLAGDSASRRASVISRRQGRRKWHKRRKRCLKFLHRTCRCHRYWFAPVLHPAQLAKALKTFLTASWFVRLGLPCLVTAFVMFYSLHNPSLDVIEQATLSWWFVFVTRQTLTLQLAIITQSIVIDGFALRSRYAVSIFSPLLTLCVISSKGWPFIFTSWAIWDLILLYGDNEFMVNWWFWTDIELFSPENEGGSILVSNIYLRLLLAMIMAGVATAIKRTTLALYFGKKTVLNYKPRMEKILADMAILSDVGELANEADDLVAAASDKNASISATVTKAVGKELGLSSEWKRIEQIELSSEDGSTSDQQTVSDTEEMKQDSHAAQAEPELGSTITFEEGAKNDSEDNMTSSAESENEHNSDDMSEASSVDSINLVTGGTKRVSFDSKRSLSDSEKHFKDLLDRWEEPVDKHDTSSDASISDILDFRKRLTVMDTPFPFSPYFGRASTRDECIDSAKKTYLRLLKLDPGSNTLSFDVIQLLAIDSDGNVNGNKRRVLRRLFRPDRFNELTLLAFVQACDSVYKRLRYFRASVGNASLIDQVLEQIIDGGFYFVLALMVLSVLELNPWALLVSISTLLFSTAFAIGPSLSRYIEGVLMIVARRPYDLGDRIMICGSENATNNPPQMSWFVEDLNLFSTTLRFANTNEVATVNNASIAMARIMNYNRSPNAIVTLNLVFMDTATDEKLEIFHETIIEGFIQDRPRIWESVLFFRCESINQDLGLMEYSLRIRHTKPWQDAASILANKAELLKFCFETGKKLEINYDSPPRASWTINSFATPDGESVPDMNAALNAIRGQGPKRDPNATEDDDGVAGAASSLFEGKMKGMRSLERRKTGYGGQFAFSR